MLGPGLDVQLGDVPLGVGALVDQVAVERAVPGEGAELGGGQEEPGLVALDRAAEADLVVEVVDVALLVGEHEEVGTPRA